MAKCVAKNEIVDKPPSLPSNISTRSHKSLRNPSPKPIVIALAKLKVKASFRSLSISLAMASMIMAASKVPISSAAAPSPAPKPKLLPLRISLPKMPSQNSLASNALKSLSVIAATSLALSPPSLAAEIEKAALFDFDLTLPIQVVQFLLLMVALDKIYYSPLGKFMDDRDAAIREKLGSVKDTSAEVKQLEQQGVAIMKAARAEIAAALSKMKKETQAEVEVKLAEGRKKVEAELQEALSKLEAQKEETMEALDSQITNLSDQIVKKVLPL